MGVNCVLSKPISFVLYHVGMGMSLESDLQEIPGIGEAKAAEIIELIEAQDSTDEAVAENVRAAWDYYTSGQESYAGKFLERAYNEL